MRIDERGKLTIQSYPEIYQDYSAISRLLSFSLWEHSGSTLVPFQHPVRLSHIIDSISHHDLKVLVCIRKALKGRGNERNINQLIL